MAWKTMESAPENIYLLTYVMHAECPLVAKKCKYGWYTTSIAFMPSHYSLKRRVRELNYKPKYWQYLPELPYK